ncbi:MAG: cell wall metabolism sensor histidine kinase WalK [Chloroflexi bacterium]|nr:cell wall metabolism sensor histidine kinase WalK [Chloroflexota bacterium]
MLTIAIAAVAIIACVAALILALVTWRTRREMNEIDQAALEILRGDHESRIRIDGSGQGNHLAEAFNRMAEQLERASRDSATQKKRLEAIMSNMTDGVIAASGNGTVVLANSAAERMLGIPSGQAVGRSFVEVAKDYDLANMVKSCLADKDHCGPESRPIEMGIPKRLVQAFMLPQRSGEVFQVLVLLQDLTEIRRLETARRELLANISHDLRTPIAAMKAVVETLQDGAIEDAEASKKFLGRMDEELDKLARLVQSLLDLSRIESGQAEFKFEPSDLAKIMREAVDRVGLQAGRAGIKAEAAISGDLPAVRVDRDRIGQVLDNLLQNSLKYTERGGSITVSAAGQEDFVAVSVADTGPGIDPEDIPRLFERFYKADKSRAQGGAGLGLAIAKHVVQAHGGRIWAENRLPRGAVFTFTLPKA